MDLKQLRYFVAVAEEGHITRAAERLGMQQPPLSAQIKAIEGTIGVHLFKRKPRGVELTEAGRELLHEAKAILARLERAVLRTQRTARGEMGRLRVAIAPTAPFHKLVPRAIRNFSKAYPLVALTLEEGLSHDAADGLINERLDVAFVRNAGVLTDVLKTIPLLEEPMILALASHHPLARANPSEQPIALGQLSDEPFILIGPPGTGLHDETIAACRGAAYSPRIGQLTPSITPALGLAATGMGIVLVPESLKSLRMEGLVYRRVTGPYLPKAFLGLAHLKGNTSEVLRQFIGTVLIAWRSISGADETSAPLR